MRTAKPRAPEHIPELDGIRGLAIAAVLAYHFGSFEGGTGFARLWSEILGLGWSGVDLFFVLSGFLITGILLDTKESVNYFVAFYMRRVLRIFPLYFAVLLLFFHVAVPLAHHFHKWLTLPIYNEKWFWIYVANWPIGRHEGISVLTPFWSLSVEEQFYIVWPSVVYFLPRRALAYFAGALIVTALVLRCLNSPDPGGIYVYVWTHFRMDSLAFGALCALIYRDATWKERCRRWIAPVACMAAAAVVFICLKQGTTDGAPVPMQRYGYTVLAVLYSCVLLRGAIGSGSGDRLSNALKWRPLVRLGTVSYGVYVLHYMIFHVLGAGMDRVVHRWPLPLVAQSVVMMVAGGLLSWAAAEFSWRFFESRILTYKRRFRYEYATRELTSRQRTVSAGS